MITRSEKETTSNETIVSDDDTGGTLFGRVDFSHQCAASPGQAEVILFATACISSHRSRAWYTLTRTANTSGNIDSSESSKLLSKDLP